MNEYKGVEHLLPDGIPLKSIDYISGLTRNSLSAQWLGECLAAANLELGLRWLNDRKTRRDTWDKSGKIKVWSIEDEVQ